MARAGQLKSKIDLLKKKIEEKGKSLSAERQRQFRKRLKRLQRARRVAVKTETAAKKPVKEAPEGASSEAAPA